MRFICSIILAIISAGWAFAGPVSYTVNDASYQGYYVSAGKNAPLVMIIHDWDGLTDYEIKRAHMLEKKGYSVFAMDLFGAVLEWARSGVDLKGFVTFHGGLATPGRQDYFTARGQYLILHGSADQSISLADFSALASESEAAGLNHEMITYGGERHAGK